MNGQEPYRQNRSYGDGEKGEWHELVNTVRLVKGSLGSPRRGAGRLDKSQDLWIGELRRLGDFSADVAQQPALSWH